MNILYLLADPLWHGVHRSSGYSTHVREMISSLERAGHSVDLLDARELRNATTSGTAAAGIDNGAHGLLPRLMPGRIRAVGRDLLYLSRNRQVETWLEKRLESGDIELIYERFHHMQTAGVRVAQRRGIPIIVEFNAGQDENVSHLNPGLVALGYRREREVMEGADRIIAISEVLKGSLVDSGVAAEKVEVLHNGVDLRRFRPDVDGRAVREKLGIPEESLVVGFVGSLAPWHGIEVLIDAASQVTRRGPDFTYLVVGGDPDSERFHEIRRKVSARDLDERFRLIGAVPFEEIPGYGAAMDIATMPGTNAYGSPLKIFEYMALGRAIIAPDRRGVREILADGDNALLIPKQAAALVQAIERLAGDVELRRSLGQRARRQAERYHSWDRHAGVVEKLFEEIAAERVSRTQL